MSLLFNTLSRFVIAFLPGSKHGNPENTGKRFHFTLWRLGSGVEESCLQRSLKVHCTCSFYFHGTRRSPTQSLWPPPILAQGALGLLLQMLCHTPPCTFPLYPNPSLMISSLSTLFLTAYLNPREHKGPALPGLEGETRVSATRNPGLSLYGRGPWHQRGKGLAQDHTAVKDRYRYKGSSWLPAFSALFCLHLTLPWQTSRPTSWPGHEQAPWHTCAQTWFLIAPAAQLCLQTSFTSLGLFVYGLPWWLRW